jgi:DNA-binding transcriptional LysR family regulator
LHSAALRYLVKVAELGSIRRAAETLNVASSAVNRQILTLERKLGVTLFKRTPTGVTPTSAGILLLRHARETLGDYQHTLDEIASQTGEIKGEVRIIGLGSMIECILPNILASLAQRYDGISFHIYDANPDEVIKELTAGHFDIGITFLDQRYRTFEVYARLKTTVGAVMKSTHPLARKKSVTLTECAAYEISMFSDRWIIKPLIDTELQRTGAEFKPRIVTNSMAVMQAVILQGMAIGFFTPIGFIDAIRRGELTYIPLSQGSFAPAGIGLFASKSALTSPPVRVIIDHLIEVFADLQVTLHSIKSQADKPMRNRRGKTKT